MVSFILLKGVFSLCSLSKCRVGYMWVYVGSTEGEWRAKAAQLVESKAVNLGKLTAREGYS